MLFGSRDFFRPGDRALVRYSGGILSLFFGEDFEGVLQLLLKRGAGHRGRVSLAHLRECVFMVMGVTHVSDGVPLIAL